LGLIAGFKINADIDDALNYDVSRMKAAFFGGDEEEVRELKKQVPKGGKNRKTNAALTAIYEKIQTAAAYLITLQSNKVIGGTSPLDEENELNTQKERNDFDRIIESSKTLDDEYYRFMAEVGLSKK
jgi:uncharacterized protein YdcH (DUF465 family)